MPDLSTFEARRAHYRETITVENGVTFGEYLKYSYHWIALEYNLIKKRHILARIDKHADALDVTDAVLNLRAEMQNL